MRPTTADDNVFDFDALLHPGTVFESSEGRGASFRPDDRREAGNPCVMGLGCVRDSILPVIALPRRTEDAGLDR